MDTVGVDRVFRTAAEAVEHKASDKSGSMARLFSRAVRVVSRVELFGRRQSTGVASMLYTVHVDTLRPMSVHLRAKGFV
jgi:hypothetical protein